MECSMDLFKHRWK